MSRRNPKPTASQRTTAKMNGGRLEHFQDFSIPPADPRRIVPAETIEAILEEIAGRDLPTKRIRGKERP